MSFAMAVPGASVGLSAARGAWSTATDVVSRVPAAVKYALGFLLLYFLWRWFSFLRGGVNTVLDAPKDLLRQGQIGVQRATELGERVVALPGRAASQTASTASSAVDRLSDAADDAARTIASQASKVWGRIRSLF